MDTIKLSIIIVHYNTPDLLIRCLRSIDKFIVDMSKEIIVVDNNSRQDLSPTSLESIKDVTLIRLPDNRGFGYANNIGAKAASGEMVFFLNSDAYLKDHSIHQALKSFFEKKEKALWGFKLLWPDGSLQNSCSRDIAFLDYILFYTPVSRLSHFIKRIGYHQYHGTPFNGITAVPIVYAAAMLMWKKDFLALDGFDEKYFMYFEDADLCFRFKNLLKGEIYYHPEVSIVHSVKGSSRKSPKMNLAYLKSKYTYGLKKFTFLSMIFYVSLDVSLMMVTLGYGSIFSKPETGKQTC